MSVGFTGTSDTVTKPQEATLCLILAKLLGAGEIWLHHGDCINADKLANDIWRSLGGKTYAHPPINPKKRAFCDADVITAPKDYLPRNRDIVDVTRRLVACPKGLTEETRSGTWATIRYAREARKNICIILPNGNIMEELWP